MAVRASLSSIVLLWLRYAVGDDSSAVDCLARYPLDTANPTVIITAVGTLSLDVIRQHSSRISFLFTAPQTQHPIWIYTDNTWDQLHGRDRVKFTDFSFPVCMIDIFRAEPWLLSVSQHGGAIDKYYDFAGFFEPCDQPLRLKRYLTEMLLRIFLLFF